MGLRKGGMLMFEYLALHPHLCVCCQVKLTCMRLIVGRGGVVGGNRPRLRAVAGLHEKFVEGEFDGWANDVERIRRRDRVTNAFTVIHGVRDGGGGKQKGRGTKVGRKEGGETKKGIVGTSTGCGNGSGSVRVFAVVVSVGVVSVLVVWRIGRNRG
jgi:hypothetical protein